MIGGAFSFVGRGLSGVIGGGQAQAQVPQELRNLRNEAQQFVASVIQPGNQGQLREWGAIMERIFSPEAKMTERDRELAVNFLVQQAGMSREQAVNTVQGWQERKEQMEGDMGQMADAAAAGAAKASFIGFFTLVMGALAAALGGRNATMRTLRSGGYLRREEARNGHIQPKV